ncbi:MAG TPA: DUF72 domain-containing protein [Rhodoblastus sp.]|nr:DUF72 domain-containing protein [Rhodoblastus sp.]
MAKTAKAAKEETGRIRVGIGGWTYEPWRGTFYPKGLAQKNELAYAAQHLTAIEINGTFYGSQKPASFIKWREETPAHFVFSVKAPRFVVQKRVLGESSESIERFFASGVAELREKLGPILWQFAPTKKFDADDFAAFLALLPREIDGQALRHALEVRHESFCCAQFVDLARKHGAAIVTARDSKYPEIADATADFAYLRIMGASEDHALGYPPKELDLWSKRLQALAKGEAVAELKQVAPAPGKSAPRDVFAFFISGFKERNPAAAMDLIARLR